MKNPFRFGKQEAQRPLAEDISNPFAVLHRAEFVSEHWYKTRYNVPSGLPATQHYLSSGSAQGCEPNPLFQGQWYVKNYFSVTEADTNPAVHYLVIGSKSGFKPNPYFDPAWYRKTYPDVASSSVEPLIHYLKYGAKEGRNPSADISTQWLPQGLDANTGQPMNPLARFLELLDLLNMGVKSQAESAL